jgi:molybdate transport system substrate-binding protein
VTGSITVFAASSLKGAFADIGTAFQAAYPGTTVTFNFGPSSGLATQITQGAPADVFAAASTKTMDTVTGAGAASNPQVFATNTMEIAAPASGTAMVTSLADLAKPGVKVAVCQKDVPCGVAATKLFDQNKLTVTPSTQEVDVKAVLSKVELGEVDAGIVYVTDVQAAGDKVKGIVIPADMNVTTKYPIAPISASKNAVTAQVFVDFVLSSAGQSILAKAGFAQP